MEQINIDRLYSLVDRVRRTIIRFGKYPIVGMPYIRCVDLQPTILQLMDAPVKTGHNLRGDDIIYNTVAMDGETYSMSFICTMQTNIQQTDLSDEIKAIVEETKLEKVNISSPENQLMCFIFIKKEGSKDTIRIHYMRELLNVCLTYIHGDFSELKINKSKNYHLELADAKNPENIFMWRIAGELLFPYEARKKAIDIGEDFVDMAERIVLPRQIVTSICSAGWMENMAKEFNLGCKNGK